MAEEIQDKEKIKKEAEKVNRIARALKHPNWLERWSAAYALGELKSPLATEALIDALRDRDFDVRRVVVEALGKLGEYRNIEGMVKRLKENFPQGDINEEIYIRKNIIEVLGDYIKESPDESIKGLLEFLAEESEYPEIKDTAQNVIASMAKAPKE